MVKNEWKSLFHNKLLLIVLIAIIAIPVIYAGFFLNSMWDPYGNVDKLPVAVVNEDQPVDYDGKTLKVGEEMVSELKKNDEMQFNFVDAKTAEDGLKNGTYYMVIKIPETFSENAATLMDDSPKKMILTYETNPGTNYIASKMSETALAKIKDSVQEEVVRTYTEAVFDQIGEAGDGMQEAADGARKLQDGIGEAADGNRTITDNLQTLAKSTLTFQDGTESLQEGIRQYTDGVAVLNEKAPTLIMGVDSLNSGASDLAAGAQSLSDGADAYVDGVEALADGTMSYVAGAEQLSDGAGRLASLEDGLGMTYQGIKSLHAAVSTDNYDGKGSPSLTTGTQKLKVGIEQISAMVTQMEGSTSAEEIQKLGEASQALSDGEDTFNQSVNDLNASVATANQTLRDQTEEANSQINSAVTAIEQAEAEAKEQGVDLDLSAQKQALENTRPSQIDSVNKIEVPAEISAIADSLAEAVAGLGGRAQVSNDPLGDLAAALAQVQAAAEKVDNGAQSISEGLGTLEKSTEAFPAAGEGIKALNNGFTKLTQNNQTLTNGAAELKKQGSNLTTGAQQVSEGAGQLMTGTQTLSQGAGLLSDGVGTLVSNNGTLNSGAGQLEDGSMQIAAGAGQLADGSEALGEGMSSLSDGSLELQEALSDGAKKVRDSKAEKQNIEMFSAPIDSEETKITEVENNGHAMAPYMLSVGLWVGALAFCLIYPLMQYKGKLKSGLAWWASKASVLYPVAVLQGLLLIGLLHLAIGFTPVQMGKTIAFACLTAVTFTSIMYFFNITLGKVGSFLMLVFMVIQLAGSAGTYPVELSPGFVAEIHWYLPFTYTVNSFRSTIAGGESIRQAVTVMTVLFVVFTALTILAFQVKTRRKKDGKMILFDWLEERGMA